MATKRDSDSLNSADRAQFIRLIELMVPRRKEKLACLLAIAKKVFKTRVEKEHHVKLARALELAWEIAASEKELKGLQEFFRKRSIGCLYSNGEFAVNYGSLESCFWVDKFADSRDLKRRILMSESRAELKAILRHVDGVWP